MTLKNFSPKLALAAAGLLVLAACSETPDLVEPAAEQEVHGIELDDPARASDDAAGLSDAPPEAAEGPAQVHGPGGTATVTFSNTVFFIDPSVPGQAFTEDGLQVTAFWWQGNPLFGHFHSFGGVENHHSQGDLARQGVVIRRQDGQSFTLQSIDYRSQGFGPTTPLEIGTAPITGISGSPTVPDGFTTVAVPATGGSFVTVPISGVENVSEVWITQRGSGSWDNIVIGPGGNEPPTADASGTPTIVECTDNAGDPGTEVSLVGAGADPDGTIVAWEWTDADGNVLATTQNATVSLGHGDHTLTLTATDDDGATGSDDVTVSIVDTTAPDLTFGLDVTEIWPPNHRMVTVATGITTFDACDDDPVLDITVTSDEPINGTGDGDTAPDWMVVDNGDGTFDVQVRAERDGKGDGRIYTITATVTDGSGNTTSMSGDVSVPHDRRGGRGR